MIKEFFTITISQNEIDGPGIQYPYLEYKVDYRSHKTRRNYDNGRRSRQEGEYADEGQSFLHSGIGKLRVAKGLSTYDVLRQQRMRQTGKLLQRRHTVSQGRWRGWLASCHVLQEARTRVELGCFKGERQGHTLVICTNFLEGRDLIKEPRHLHVPCPCQGATHRTTVIRE